MSPAARRAERSPDIPLARYGAFVRRHRWLILALAVVGAVIGASLGSRTTTYVASSSVVVDPATLQQGVAQGDIGRDAISADTESHIATSTPVLEAARRATGINEPLLQFADRLTLDAPPNTRVLTLRFSAGNPKTAAVGAVAAANAYLLERAHILGDRRDAGLAQLNAQISGLQPRMDAAAVAANQGTATDRLAAASLADALSHDIRNLREQRLAILTSGPSIGALLRPPDDTRLHTRGGGMVPITSGALIGLAIALLIVRLRPEVAGDRADAVLSADPTVAATDVLATVHPIRRRDSADRDVRGLRNVVVAGGGGITLVCGVADAALQLELSGRLARALAALGGRAALITRPGEPAPFEPTVTELLLTEVSAVTAVRTNFDHVIVALPGRPDADLYEIAANADRVVVVSEPRKTTVADLSELLRQLQLVGAPIAGTVLVRGREARMPRFRWRAT